MIIHLKRFQFTQHMRRKLREMVIFPVEGLDFSRIIASDEEHQSSGSTNKTNKESKANNFFRPDLHDGRTESLYDLYGVVHHQGALTIVNTSIDNNDNDKDNIFFINYAL